MNIVKHTNVRVALKNTNTLAQLRAPKINHITQDHERSGLYKLTCNTWKLSCIWQTSRSPQQRYKDYTRYIKQNDPQSSYAVHILNNQHEYGTSNDTMTLLKHINRPTLLLPYEQFYIQTYHHQQQPIREQDVNRHNPMYRLIHDLHNTSLLTCQPINNR